MQVHWTALSAPLKLVSYILRCSCHKGQPSRIRDLLHHAIVVALYPIQHKNQTLIQPKSNSPSLSTVFMGTCGGASSVNRAHCSCGSCTLKG
eukprot:jgi/Chrzof1/11880/Cz06g13110.t1